MKRRGFLSGIFALPFAGVSKGVAAVKPAMAYGSYVTALAGDVAGSLNLTAPMPLDDSFFDLLSDPDLIRKAYHDVALNITGPGMNLSGKRATIGGTSFLSNDGEDMNLLPSPECCYDLHNLPPGHA